MSLRKHIISSILVLFGAGMFFSCENSIEKVNLVTTQEVMPTETVIDGEFLYSDSAQVKFRLSAPRLDRYPGNDPHVKFPLGIKVESYNDAMEVVYRITSKQATRYEKEGLMVARDSVVVVTNTGEKLETELLNRDEKTGKIYTDQFVVLTTEEEIIQGFGLESNKEFTEYEVLRPTGIFTIKEEEENPPEQEEANTPIDENKRIP